MTFQTTTTTLQTALSPFGTLVSCSVNQGPTGGGDGTGQAEYTTAAAATSAAAAMNGATLDGAVITVVVA